MAVNSQLTVGGTKIDVTNLDKVLYPKIGFTKGQVRNDRKPIHHGKPNFKKTQQKELP
jgi:hypothetical protein